MSDTNQLFLKFVEIIAALRQPETGCPWDLEQDHKTLRPYLIEEAYEVLEAIDSENDKELAKELGDLLLQVVLHAQVAKDRNSFTIDEVIKHVSDKMIRRHPHVFGDINVKSSSEVLQNWEQIKSKEREAEGAEQGQTLDNKKPSLLSGVPMSMPALLVAQRLSEKAAAVGFDWDSVSDIWDKVLEETEELKQEIDFANPAASSDTPQKRAALEHELGDLLFTLCQVARHVGLSAEDALRVGCERFKARFQYIENNAPQPVSELDFSELEALWQKAKVALK